MRIGAAFLWEFRRRHQLGLIALGAYLLVFSVIKFLVLGPAYPLRLDPPNGMAAFVFVPATFTFFYFIGVFTYGLSGDLAARQSIFPARLFALPVTSAALAGWPMLYGSIAGASLYLFFAIYMRLAGASYLLPLVWPPLFVAAYFAWTQALMWMPYGFTGMRVIVAVAWLFVFDIIVLVAFENNASETLMVALVAPHLPIAYLVAWFAVARARRGVVPDWQRLFAARLDALSALTRRRTAFASPAQAQAWFERRRHGRSLPWMVALALPFELWLLFIPGNETNITIVVTTLIVALLTPPFLAFFAAAMVSPQTPFMITRPLTTIELAAAKLKATWWSAVTAWVVALVIVPIAVVWSQSWPTISDPVLRSIRYVGTAHAVAIAALVLLALLLTTWRQLIQSLCIGSTGRPWVIKSTVLIALVSVILLFPAYRVLTRNAAVQTALWYAFPWILMMLVAIKCSMAAWIGVRLHNRGLLSDRGVMVGAVSWLATVAIAYVALTLFVASPAIPRYLIASIVILSVPLVRLSALPLAVAWSRHQ